MGKLKRTCWESEVSRLIPAVEKLAWKKPLARRSRRKTGEIAEDNCDQTIGGMAIPQRDRGGLASWRLKSTTYGSGKTLGIAPDECVCSVRQSNGAFGVLAHSKARNAEKARFFLNAAGIGDDDSGVLLQSQEFQIGQGIEQEKARRWLEGRQFAYTLLCSRMNWENHGKLFRALCKDAQSLVEPGQVIHVGRSMERDQDVRTAELKITRWLGLWQKTNQGIDHHVADAVDLF